MAHVGTGTAKQHGHPSARGFQAVEILLNRLAIGSQAGHSPGKRSRLPIERWPRPDRRGEQPPPQGCSSRASAGCPSHTTGPIAAPVRPPPSSAVRSGSLPVHSGLPRARRVWLVERHRIRPRPRPGAAPPRPDRRPDARVCRVDPASAGARRRIRRRACAGSGELRKRPRAREIASRATRAAACSRIAVTWTAGATSARSPACTCAPAARRPRDRSRKTTVILTRLPSLASTRPGATARSSLPASFRRATEIKVELTVVHRDDCPGLPGKPARARLCSECWRRRGIDTGDQQQRRRDRGGDRWRRGDTLGGGRLPRTSRRPDRDGQHDGRRRRDQRHHEHARAGPRRAGGHAGIAQDGDGAALRFWRRPSWPQRQPPSAARTGPDCRAPPRRGGAAPRPEAHRRADD